MAKKGKVALVAGLGIGVATLAKRRGVFSALARRLPGRRHGTAAA